MERTRLMDYGYYGLEDEEFNAKEEKGAKAQRKEEKCIENELSHILAKNA